MTIALATQMRVYVCLPARQKENDNLLAFAVFLASLDGSSPKSQEINLP
jgi:hypothetical protein